MIEVPLNNGSPFWRINFGHVLTIIAMLGSVAVIYGDLRAVTSANAANIATYKAELDAHSLDERATENALWTQLNSIQQQLSVLVGRERSTK